MISLESLRQYSNFAQLNEEQLNCLVESSTKLKLAAGKFLFHIVSNFSYFYLVEKGEFEIVFEVPKLEKSSEAFGKPIQINRGRLLDARLESLVFMA